ncbi:sulfite exporter TauE/SafE family protein [Williamsia sterculiae]|uniref:Probable membrane transporter protein n=1 Tax=Williamsia sterculiae TaxID=1344003 RepID=A0A1N7H157_9NOCA|nr:sulfite exporter TauE/SafE family protein [Williamsia sterculiae]SIS18490.1 hypothetical protein SAMN05445060_3340 [Williamsia sterculiae]
MTDVVLLVGAGVVAGVLGSAGGMTSLVSYWTLLAIGLPAISASVANLVACAACGPGSALASRQELRRARLPLSAGLPAVMISAGGGALLLHHTSAAVFGRVAPWLVAFASLALLVQPWLTTLVRRHSLRSPMVAWLGVGVVSVYGGYFGAGSGIMLLTLLLAFVDERMPQANALKNLLAGAAAIASAVIIVSTGPVLWHIVIPLAVGLFLGSTLGPPVTRRIPAGAIRWCGVALGAALTAELALSGG